MLGRNEYVVIYHASKTVAFTRTLDGDVLWKKIITEIMGISPLTIF